MASFRKYQTKQGGKWLFKMDTGKDPATGQRRTTTRRGFNKKKDAEAAANELLASLRDDTYDNRKMTFEEVYLEWLQYNQDSRRLNTTKSRESTFRNHVLPFFAKLEIRKINRSYCQRFVNELVAKK
jgi:hypothetical protein